jgi:hypothetical protein
MVIPGKEEKDDISYLIYAEGAGFTSTSPIIRRKKLQLRTQENVINKDNLFRLVARLGSGHLLSLFF